MQGAAGELWQCIHSLVKALVHLLSAISILVGIVACHPLNISFIALLLYISDQIYIQFVFEHWRGEGASKPHGSQRTVTVLPRDSSAQYTPYILVRRKNNRVLSPRSCWFVAVQGCHTTHCSFLLRKSSPGESPGELLQGKSESICCRPGLLRCTALISCINLETYYFWHAPWLPFLWGLPGLLHYMRLLWPVWIVVNLCFYPGHTGRIHIFDHTVSQGFASFLCNSFLACKTKNKKKASAVCCYSLSFGDMHIDQISPWLTKKTLAQVRNRTQGDEITSQHLNICLRLATANEIIQGIANKLQVKEKGQKPKCDAIAKIWIFWAHIGFQKQGNGGSAAQRGDPSSAADKGRKHCTLFRDLRTVQLLILEWLLPNNAVGVRNNEALWALACTQSQVIGWHDLWHKSRNKKHLRVMLRAMPLSVQTSFFAQGL